MDQEENNQLHHSLGISIGHLKLITKRLTEAAIKLTILGTAFFRWFFEFIIQNLSTQAMKHVTLGPPVHHSSSRAPNFNTELVAREWPSQESQKPRKTVSINDRAEMVIAYPREGKDRKKASDKLPSIEGKEGDEPKP
ncbi:hypothetical protein U1Q18_043523 [Sarracenia purpurea var. burkii]